MSVTFLLARLADVGPAPGPGSLWTAWRLEPTVVAGLLAVAAVYVYCVHTVWRRSGVDRGVRIWQAQAFIGGLAALIVALLSPLDGLSLALFSAHMLQHLLLILVAAPLLVLGAPLPVLSALPRRLRGLVVRLRSVRGVHTLTRLIGRLDVAWVLNVLALWGWHLPLLYEAALANPAIHVVEHLSLLGTAIAFWHVVLARLRLREQCGSVVLAQLAMAGQSTVLGVALTFSATPWYSSYAASAPNWGMSGLVDQQLAGLIMWIPAGAVYLGAALFTLAVLISEDATAVPPSPPAAVRIPASGVSRTHSAPNAAGS